MNSPDSHQRWSSRLSPARDRIQTCMFVPSWQPSFRLDSSQTVFAVGSCFARNLESELANSPLRLTSVDPENPLMEIRTNPKLGLLNKYNPVSFHQELA